VRAKSRYTPLVVSLPAPALLDGGSNHEPRGRPSTEFLLSETLILRQAQDERESI
jgi:hypothetical protein